MRQLTVTSEAYQRSLGLILVSLVIEPKISIIMSDSADYRFELTPSVALGQTTPLASIQPTSLPASVFARQRFLLRTGKSDFALTIGRKTR
jgi:hypothetical protein